MIPKEGVYLHPNGEFILVSNDTDALFDVTSSIDSEVVKWHGYRFLLEYSEYLGEL
jgi:hypothetical protein